MNESTPINILVLTGAGISAESGISTYRDADGLWTKYNPSEVSHINGWKKDPLKVLEFKNKLRQDFAANNYQPNAAHYALTRLQKEWKHGSVTLVTQNIDGLHAAAGSEILEIHGTVKDKFCESCGHRSPYNADILADHACINCGKLNTTRPFVVMFGEMPLYLDYIENMLDQCHVYIAIGTSGEVMPASLFVSSAKQVGARTYLINKEEGSNSEDYDFKLLGKATEIVPAFVETLLNGSLLENE
jgi:NAD-dependent deacetylase